MFVLPPGKITQNTLNGLKGVKKHFKNCYRWLEEEMIAFLRCSGVRRDFGLTSSELW